MKKNLNAFTLAETLISLTIIGVIAVLTMPSLISGFQKKVYVSNVQKVYNLFSDAGHKYMADNNADSLTETDLTTISGVGEFLNKYFKVVKDCGIVNNNGDDCFASSYKNVEGSAGYTPDYKDRYCVVINTGAVICMGTIWIQEADDYNPWYHEYANIIFDINGVKPPNTKGRDLFSFELYSDGKISEGYNEWTKDNLCNANVNDGGYAAGCFSKIMHNNWEMDY